MNPFPNALLAIAYIIGLVTIVSNLPVFSDQGGSIFAPMVMLSLLVLSVSVMAYLFFYKPVVLLLDGEREKAVKLFLQTIGIFAVATIVVLLAALAFPGVGNM